MKQIIWSSEDRLDDNARERYQEFQREVQDDNTYIVSDEEWADEVYGYLDDERHNLNKHIDGVIMVFADLGLWYGRRQGYQILGSNIADILHSQCDEAEWYGDGYNIRGRMIHHDGTNYVLYRIAKDRDEAERIAAKIYSGETVKSPRKNEKHAMDATTVYGMCCGIFLLFCMKGPFCGPGNLFYFVRTNFYIYLFSLFYYFLFASIIRTVSRLLFLQISIAACRSAQGPPCLLAKNLPHRLRWRAYFSQHPCSWTGRQSSGRKINSLPVQDCIRGKIKNQT